MQIEKFSISGLFGKKDVELTFRDKVVVYIGENGLGKTTILSALYFMLSCKFAELLELKFDSISITINTHTFKFSRMEIKEYVDLHEAGPRSSTYYSALSNLIDDRLMRELRPHVMNSRSPLAAASKLKAVLKKAGIEVPVSGSMLAVTIKNIIADRERLNFSGALDGYVSMMKNSSERFLFLPTYRRIEKDFSDFLAETRRMREAYMHDDAIRQIGQYIHFGMKDVKDRIAAVLSQISEISRMKLNDMSSSLLKEGIIGFQHTEELKSADIDKINKILKRKEVGLNEEETHKLLKLIETNEISQGNHKALLFQLNKLAEIYDSYQEFEQGIISFIDVCNGYLYDKKFVYNSSELKLDLLFTQEKGPIAEIIDLDSLSSGEKQIIALFAMTYLIPQHFSLFIDEPELSLSVFWQKRLIGDIIKSPYCDFLAAMTHSPYIFEEEEVFKHTVALSQFVKSNGVYAQ